MLANIKKAALALAFASLSTGAVAQVYQWSFTTSGVVFAFLDYDTVTKDFRLYDNSANAYLNDTAPSSIGVNGIAFSFGSSVGAFPSTVSTYQGAYDSANANAVMGEFSSVASPVSGLDYELISSSNRRTDEIGNGESTSLDFGTLVLPNDPLTWTVALRLNTNNANATNYLGNGSWIKQSSVVAIPEADTSTMMVLGLGVLGFVVKRRKQA